MKSFQIASLATAMLLLGYTQFQLVAIRHSLDAGEARQAVTAVSGSNNPCTQNQLYLNEAKYLPVNVIKQPAPEPIAPPEAVRQARDAIEQGNKPDVQIVEDILARGAIETADISKTLSELNNLPDSQRQQALQQLTQHINNQEIQILQSR